MKSAGPEVPCGKVYEDKLHFLNEYRAIPFLSSSSVNFDVTLFKEFVHFIRLPIWAKVVEKIDLSF